jgi:hypothetical protein
MSLIILLKYVYGNGLFGAINEFIRCIHAHLDFCKCIFYGYHNLIKYVYKC